MKRRPGAGRKRMKPMKQLENIFASFTSFKGEKKEVYGLHLLWSVPVLTLKPAVFN